MTRFAVNDAVTTPQGATGRIATVWPSGPRGKATYAVQIAGNHNAVIYTETQLRAAAHVPVGNTVRCGDCRHTRSTAFAPNSVYCLQFQRVKSRTPLRHCRLFKPIKPAQEA